VIHLRPMRSIFRPLLLVMLCLWSGSGLAHREPAVRVAAASSLTVVLGQISDDFHRMTGHARPEAAFAGSSRIAHQLVAGAPADVVGMANPDWMEALVEQGIVVAGTPRDLLANRLVLAVPVGDATDVADLTQLRDERWRRVAIAGESVPAGRYAREAIDALGLTEDLASRFVVAPNVRNTLALIARLEVDAGFVYRTDAIAEDRVRIAYTLDAGLHSTIRYPFALTEAGQSSAVARAFFLYLQSDAAFVRFEAAGFGRASAGSIITPTLSVAAPQAEVAPPLRLSLWVATVSLLISLFPAIGLGWLMARRQFWGKAALSTVLLAPLVLPPVVTGFILLRIFGRQGPLAPVLEFLGLEVAFTHWGAVVAAAVVGFPLLLILTRQAIEGVDPRYPALAQTLGLGPFQAFRRVTLRMALPGITAGAVLAFTRALGEFGATAMIAGDRPGETRTLALAVYALAEQPSGEAAATTLVWVSLALSFVALVVYERLVWRQLRRKEDRR
jgi:molybdate transport system permease protein